MVELDNKYGCHRGLEWADEARERKKGCVEKRWVGGRKVVKGLGAWAGGKG